MSRILYPRNVVTAPGKLVTTEGVKYLRAVDGQRLRTTNGVDYRVQGAAFDPRTIAGLQLWFRGDASSLFTDAAGTVPVAADGDTVRRWNEISGNGHSAMNAASNGVWKPSTVNGHGKIVFVNVAGGNLQISGSALGILNNVGGATVIVVAVPGATSPVSQLVTFSVNGSTNARAQLGGAASYVASMGSRRLDGDVVTNSASPTGQLANGVPHVQTGVIDYTNGTQSLRVNGTLVAGPTARSSGNTSPTASTSAGIAGFGSLAGTMYDGAIAEILVYNVALSTANVSLLERALGARYGITVA